MGRINCPECGNSQEIIENYNVEALCETCEENNTAKIIE